MITKSITIITLIIIITIINSDSECSYICC